MSKTLAKKIFAGLSAAAVTLTAFPAFVAAAAHPVGTNVDYQGTVWMIYNGQSGVCRRAYTSAGAFLSYGFNSWSQVVAANADDLALPVCSEGFIPPQDGGIIFSDRGADKGTGYVISGGMKYGFPTEAAFKGQGYSYSNATWADVSWMSMGGVINDAAAAHVPGTLINNGGTVQLVGNSGLMGIPDIATFNSWGYSFAKVVPANAADTAKAQTGVMATRQAGQLSPVAMTTTPTPQTGPFSAMVASSSPASSTLVDGQALADLAHFTIMGTGTVSSVQLKRLGVSANTTPSSVFLFDGATRLTDAASFGSDNKATFAGLNWSVSGSRTISVRAHIADSTAGQTVGVQLVQINAADLASMPSGNLHTIADASLATVAMSNASTIADIDPGTDILVFQGTATVGVRDVTLTRFALRQIGSIQSSDIKNFRLYADGVQVASVTSLDSNGYATFATNTTLKSGARILKVMADVVGGSGRTVQMSLRGAFDIGTTDSQYNVGVLATGTFPFGDSTTAAVNTGTLTVVKATDSPSSNVVSGASDQSLGKFTFTAFGEAVKVETLRVGMLGTTTGTITDATLRNVRVLVNGSQVGSTTDVPFAAAFAAASGTSFTSNFTVNPGTPATVEIRGDVVDNEDNGADNDDIAAGTLTAIQATLVGGTATNNGVPQVSLGTINVPSATNVTANSLTVGSGSISIAQTSTYPAQSVSVPQSNYKVASFQLTGNANEAVNINTIDVGFVGGDQFDPSTYITNAMLKIGGVDSIVKPSISDGTTTNLATSWSVNFVLGVNETKAIEVWANLGSGFTVAGGNDTITAYIRATGTTAVSGTTVYADTDSDTDNTDAGKAGQVITAATGTISAKAVKSPDAALVDDSGTVTTGIFTFTGVTDSFTVTDITLTLGSTTAVSNVALKYGSTTVNHPATSLTFNNLNIPVAANGSTDVTVELTMGTIGVGAGTSDSSLATTLGAYTFRNSAGTSTTYLETLTCGTDTDCTAVDDGTDAAGNTSYAYKAIPTLTAVALPTSTIAAGSGKVLAKFTVGSAGTGPLAWKQVMLEISKTATPTIASVALYNANTGLPVTSVFTFNNETVDATPTVCGADATSCELLITVGTNADDDVVETISDSKTYEVRATIGGAVDNTADNISVTLDSNTTTHTGKGIFTAVDNAGAGAANPNDASFVWSDESSTATNDTGVSSWNDDFLVKTRPLNWNLD